MTHLYFDHNATSPLRPEVRSLMDALLDQDLGNPSSVHEAGRRARAHLDEARQRAAAALGVGEDNLVFTSGGTEANNLALLGTLELAQGGGGLVTTAVEHMSVLGPAGFLEQRGHPVVRVGVDAQGTPDLERLISAAEDPQNVLVSVMAANNEVGSLGPLLELGGALAEFPPELRPILHTDAVQALGKVECPLESWGVDLASFSAHKLGGPLGVGILVRRHGLHLHPRLHGGGQEHELRPGTENVPAIAGAALAVELAVQEQSEYALRTSSLLNVFWQEVRTALPEVRLAGPELDAARLPNTINLRLPGADGRVLVTRLDLEGLEASAGSACASGSLEPSHVLLAMGRSREDARAGLRISLGRTTTAEDVRASVDILQRNFSANVSRDTSPPRAGHS